MRQNTGKTLKIKVKTYWLQQMLESQRFNTKDKNILFFQIFCGVYSMNSYGAKNSKNKHEERTIGKRARKLELNELWMIKTTLTHPW